MSSMRNAVQRRNHKERAQPLERQKWGVLEKHKDYVLRAKDYGQKKKQLKRLREKAADRNPDEFRFAMMSSRTRDGGQRVANRGDKALSTDAVKLLKTQDAGYLRVAAQKTRNERLKLMQAYNLRFSEDANENLRLPKGRASNSNSGRTVFVDSKEAQGRYTTNGENERSPVSDDEESVTDLTVRGTKPNTARVIKNALQRKSERQQQTREIRLEELNQQVKELAAAQRGLLLQRARINSTVGGITRAGIKWKVRERRK